MKSLFELCEPRDSVFDETKRDDVLDLTDLIENNIDPNDFFDENFITEGMKLLFDSAFKRFHKKSSTGLIKLTQAMGGGKTHNMISLGLLSKYPNIREKIMGDKYKKDDLGKIKIVVFTGRESDSPFGIWGSIAEQLGKKDVFKDYYSPLSAPGQTAWIKLLQGEPLLILLDELPPYLENAKSKTIGNTDLSVVTTNALANLFTALGKQELSNVCLVISDLKATYESGSELLQSSFKELENEVNRSSINIEPVESNSDEVYHILRKRLFKILPDNNEIIEIANSYKDSVLNAKQMGYTSTSPESIFVGIKDSYPFHPAIKDLYARFKENSGFQQTRGLIRFMRLVVSQLYSGDKKSKKKYLINAYDFDLNQQDMLTTITQIKGSLSNAISHDISSNGKAVAEIVDKELSQNFMQELSKLLLVSSLSDVPNSLLGLSLQEIIGYMCEPDKDITQVKKALDEFIMKAWYLYSDRDGRLYFKNVKNLIAELNSLVDSYDNENAKKEIRKFLEEKFKPSVSDCYQQVQIFPAVDEIILSENKVLLVLNEPYTQGGLNHEINSFYENTRYKNRVMFLTGQRNTMDNLLKVSKELKAIRIIINRMKEEKVPENNPQYTMALEKLDKITLNLLQASRETFVTLYYPISNGLTKADFLMEFRDNNFNGEEQIKNILLQKQKFTQEITNESFQKKCESRLFTQKEMRWIDVKERSATNISWQWHIMSALDKLKDDLIRKNIWRENGGYIEKPPFPKEKTDLFIQEIRRDDETGEVTLKITPKYGNKVFYEIGQHATNASLSIENLNEFKTKELNLSFICVDSNDEHETGEAKEWKNRITLKYKVYDRGSEKVVVLESAPSVPIKYTTDGSNPKENGGNYESEFVVPANATHILAIAESSTIYSDSLEIRIDRSKIKTFEIDKNKKLKLKRKVKTNDTAQTYNEINILKKYNISLSGVTIVFQKSNDGWIEINTDPTILVTPESLEKEFDSIRLNFMPDGKVEITIEIKNLIFSSGQKFYDWVAEKKHDLTSFKEEEITQ